MTVLAPARSFLSLVKVEHSVFALPFAYLAALTAMAQRDRHVHWTTLGLVTVAMVGARTFAMAANRIIDRRIGVRSVPARYGVPFALYASTGAHVLTFALFVWYGILVGFGPAWWLGLLVTAAAFAYEHAIVRPGDLSRVNRAFFTANGFVGIALFVFALVDLVGHLGLRP